MKTSMVRDRPLEYRLAQRWRVYVVGNGQQITIPEQTLQGLFETIRRGESGEIVGVSHEWRDIPTVEDEAR